MKALIDDPKLPGSHISLTDEPEALDRFGPRK